MQAINISDDEENLNNIRIADEIPFDVGDVATHPLLGLFFKDIELFEDGTGRRARFVMNDFWKAHRPGDDQRGETWLRRGQFD